MACVEGDVLLGRYRVTQMLGEGGYGTVCHCVDEKTGQPCAVKIEQFSPEMSCRYLDIHQSVVHPNIYKLLDFRISDNHARLITVTPLYDSEVPYMEEAEDWYGAISQLLNALAYLEEHRIVHLDIKPENLLWKDEQYPVLIDLGEAHRLEDRDTVRIYRRAAGTVPYRAPETIASLFAYCKSDVWSMACTLYELITDEVLSMVAFGDEWENVMTRLVKLSRNDSRIRRKDAQTMEYYQDLFAPYLAAIDDMNAPTLVKKLLRKMLVVDVRHRPGARELLRWWNKRMGVAQALDTNPMLQYPYPMDTPSPTTIDTRTSLFDNTIVRIKFKILADMLHNLPVQYDENELEKIAVELCEVGEPDEDDLELSALIHDLLRQPEINYRLTIPTLWDFAGAVDIDPHKYLNLLETNKLAHLTITQALHLVQR